MPYSNLLNIFILACMWSPSFILMKLALEHGTPLTIIAIRLFIATLVLLAIRTVYLKKLVLDRSKVINSLVLAILMNIVPFVCFCYSLLFIPTSLSALINCLTPVVSIILAVMLLDEEKLDLYKASGMFFGLAGSLLIILPSFFSYDDNYNAAGLTCSTVGALSYALGMIYAKINISTPENILGVLPVQFAIAAIVVTILSFMFENPVNILYSSTYKFWMHVILLSIFSTALSLLLYYKILIKGGISLLSMTSYLSVVLGAVFFKEQMSVNFYLSCIFIFAGVFMVTISASRQKS